MLNLWGDEGKFMRPSRKAIEAEEEEVKKLFDLLKKNKGKKIYRLE